MLMVFPRTNRPRRCWSWNPWVPASSLVQELQRCWGRLGSSRERPAGRTGQEQEVGEGAEGPHAYHGQGGAKGMSELCFSSNWFPGSCIGTGQKRILSDLIRGPSTAIGLGRQAAQPARQTL